MRQSRKNRSIRGILIFIVASLLLSGSIRLGSISIAVASSPSTDPLDVDDNGNENACTTDAETQELMDLLKIREQRIAATEIEQSERELELSRAEASISENLIHLEEIEAQLSQTIQKVDSASSDDVNQLTAVYQSMKPKDAALLFEQMTPEFASGFLAEMSTSAAAGILSGLSSEKAYAISVVLAGRNANALRN